MRSAKPLVAVLLVLAACEQQTNEEPTASPPEITAEAPRPGSPRPEAGQLRWRTAGGSEGAHARLLAPDGTMMLSLGCRMGSGELEVFVPGLTLIGSEDRLSIGFDDNPIALAVDMKGEGEGVRARGAVPADIAERITSATGIGVSYGRHNLGPYAPMTGDDARSLTTACAPAAGRAEP